MENWVRCTQCRHKLFYLNEVENVNINMSIKCHSCKKINEIILTDDIVRKMFEREVIQ